MDADLLLLWASETGCGSIEGLRERAAWLARTTALVPTRRASGRCVQDLATLAHIDLDWAAGNWSASPSVLTRLPGGDGFALLTGARPAALERELRNILEQNSVDLARVSQHAGPGDLPARGAAGAV